MARPSSPLGRASATAKTPSSDAPHGRGGSRGATGKTHGAERAAAGGGARRGGGRERRRERRVIGLVGELEDRGRVRGRRDDAHHDPAGRVGVVSRGARRKYGDSVVRRQRCAGTAQAVAAAAAAAEAVAMRVRVVCVPMVCIYACAETTDGERLHV